MANVFQRRRRRRRRFGLGCTVASCRQLQVRWAATDYHAAATRAFAAFKAHRRRATSAHRHRKCTELARNCTRTQRLAILKMNIFKRTLTIRASAAAAAAAVPNGRRCASLKYGSNCAESVHSLLLPKTVHRKRQAR